DCHNSKDDLVRYRSFIVDYRLMRFCIVHSHAMTMSGLYTTVLATDFSVACYGTLRRRVTQLTVKNLRIQQLIGRSSYMGESLRCLAVQVFKIKCSRWDPLSQSYSLIRATGNLSARTTHEISCPFP
ncbi:unnamed protein product, partial [Dicrocoelium dendriticum]